MGYLEKRYISPNAIEVEQYHSRFHKYQGLRSRKRELTPEEKQKLNHRGKVKKCRRKLRLYFEKNDYLVTLTYRKDNRPENMDQCKKDWSIFIRKLRDWFRKKGIVFRWIRNIEVGTRGAWHIHVVIKRAADLDIKIRECWPHGKVSFQLLYEKGEFAALAGYMTKCPLTDKKLKESHYWASRNMPIPDPVQKARKWKTWHKTRIPQGYFLDKDSFYESINPITGYPYREYTLIRIRGGDTS